MPSGRTFNDVFAHTVSWLLIQGYIYSYGHHPRERDILTDKALAAMNVVPPSLDHTRGSELVDATKDASSESGKRKLAELAGSFIGSAVGSIVKSVSGG